MGAQFILLVFSYCSLYVGEGKLVITDPTDCLCSRRIAQYSRCVLSPTVLQRDRRYYGLQNKVISGQGLHSVKSSAYLLYMLIVSDIHILSDKRNAAVKIKVVLFKQ